MLQVYLCTGFTPRATNIAPRWGAGMSGNIIRVNPSHQRYQRAIVFSEIRIHILNARAETYIDKGAGRFIVYIIGKRTARYA